ncbi:MAG: ATP-dependent acyl-CoA ligase [bacterium]|nr:ATP-dependent acyl-CoA ligase [bacterium]
MTSSHDLLGVNLFAGWDVPRLVSMQATRRADHTFLIWEPFEGEGRTWTYGEFDRATRSLAAGLAGRGIRPGDRILIHLDNCPEATLAWYACAHLGAVAVTTNVRSAGEELAYFADDSEAVAAISQPALADLVSKHCKRIRWIAVTETDSGAAPAQGKGPDHASSFERLYGDPADAHQRPADPLLPVSIQYTSGTTSRPKGVVWTHANALWGGKINAMHETLTPDDVHLCYLPLFHANAQAYSVLATLWAGATVVVQPRFSASRFWSVSLRHKCTWNSTIPFCIKALAQYEVPEHHYRLWGTGVCSAPWDDHFKVTTIGWWGMTETITHGIVSDPHLPGPPMSIGRPASMYEIAILDGEGRPVEPGDTGRLKIKGVRGVSLFLEYLNNSIATQESFDECGFFDTGDRVVLLENGFIQWGDRDKDMLKVGGENVAASEIERVILSVPGVDEVSVVAKKHDMLDEVPVAFVIPHGGIARAPDGLVQDIEAACAEALADFKHPHEVRLVDSMPRSTLEKVAKNKLRESLETEG